MNSVRTIRIFISSPGDVEEERERARRVIELLQRQYLGKLELKPIFWEDLPLEVVEPFQKGIDSRVSKDMGIDVAIFILWSRLGSPVGNEITKSDGSQYRSGTEREFDLMLEAYANSDDGRPAILAYLREDDTGFSERLKGGVDALEEMVHQKRLAETFIRENFYDSESNTNVRAFHSFDQPTTFSKRLRVHLKNKLDEFVMGSEQIGQFWDIEEKGLPYRGLEVFDTSHSRIFFGREQEICDIQVALQTQEDRGSAFLLMVGASGSGKSSLARAGVIPTLQEFEEDSTEWRFAIMTPGQSPTDLCAGLANALIQETAFPDLIDSNVPTLELAKGLRENPELVINLRILEKIKESDGSKSDATKLILLIDQLEELFTYPSILKEDATSFLDAVRALSVTGCVWVLATIRSDFYPQIHQFPDLVALKEGSGLFDVLPPERTSLSQIILEPALMAGLKFEPDPQSGEGLQQRILNDAMEHPDALPLVEYTLRELAESRSKEGLLRIESYDALGGIEGAIGKRAEAIFDLLSESAQQIAPSFFRSLASIGNDGQFISRNVKMKELARKTDEKEIVDAFASSRLLILNNDGDDEPIVRIAHEALLSSWPQFQKWLLDAKQFLETRQKLEVSLNQTLESNGGNLNGYFAENRDLVIECGTIIREYGLFSEEAAFLFRSSLTSGIQMLEWSRRLEEDFPETRIAIIDDVINCGPSDARRNLLVLMRSDRVREIEDQIVDLAIHDPDESVRNEAAVNLVYFDNTELYIEAIQNALGEPDKQPNTISTLSRMRITADKEIVAPNFEAFFAGLDRDKKKRVKQYAFRTRLAEGAPAIPCVMIPAALFAALSAGAYKWFPSMFNWAIVQVSPSAAMGIFHGIVAGVIWAGGIALGIILYHIALGKSTVKRSMLNPLGSIVTAVVSSWISSAIVIFAIVGVFTVDSLYQMGWILNNKIEHLGSEFLGDLFVRTRFGWAHFVTGSGIGVGMALMTNSLWATGEWEEFLKRQSRLDSFAQTRSVIGSLMKIAARHLWPLPLSIAVSSIGAFFIINRSIVYDVAIIDDGSSNVSYLEGNTSDLGIIQGLIGDCSTQAIGAYFAIVGMGLGMVILRHGLQIQPRKN